ncbi:hypothetical protein PGT21_002322 [Puccinia graminis f. sp. tritici]|uniref:Uncharacterized protein n=1 Tax=Puccinia graminis f. sp. tritici TaxID=56615 RepID=A0A5B0MDW3_PUCGR|nr:hypothetical protein PGT21_002322 [Puccinia graminis f. sp. tritici]
MTTMMMIVKQANKAVDPSASTRGYIGVVESHEGLGRRVLGRRIQRVVDTAKADDFTVSSVVARRFSGADPSGCESGLKTDGSSASFASWFPIVRSKLMDWEPQQLRWMAVMLTSSKRSCGPDDQTERLFDQLLLGGFGGFLFEGIPGGIF